MLSSVAAESESQHCGRRILRLSQLESANNHTPRTGLNMDFWLQFDAALHFVRLIKSGAQRGFERMKSNFKLKGLVWHSAKNFPPTHFD